MLASTLPELCRLWRPRAIVRLWGRVVPPTIGLADEKLHPCVKAAMRAAGERGPQAGGVLLLGVCYTSRLRESARWFRHQLPGLKLIVVRRLAELCPQESAP